MNGSRPLGNGGPAAPRGRGALGAVVGSIALAIVLVLGPTAPLAGSSAPARAVGAATGPTSLAAPTTVSATVTWNGVPVGDASSASSAFLVGPEETASVVFRYTEPNGTAPVDNASLVLRYLDLTLSVESIRTTTVNGSGSAQLNWTFGSLIYLTEGVYELDADLLDVNGTVLFHEAFYIDARAPLLVASAIVLFAIVLAGAEVLWVVTVIQSRRRRRREYRRR